MAMLTLSKFSDNDKICLCLKGVQHPDDIFMPQSPQDLNLLPQRFDVFVRLTMFQNEFQSDNLSCILSSAFVDLHRCAEHEAKRLKLVAREQQEQENRSCS